MTTTQDAGVTVTPAAQLPAGTPRLTAPILVGFAGAIWASRKAKKLGITTTRRYWIAAAISTGVSMLLWPLIIVLVLMMFSASMGSTSTFNNPSAVSPLGNAGDPPVVQPNPANPNTSATMYGFRPAKDDLAGAVVWSVKDRAYCHMIPDQMPCLSQLYSTRGQAYDWEVAQVSNGSGYAPEAWGATDIAVTSQSEDHFTADFTVTASQDTVTSSPVRGSFTWNPSLGIWQVDDFAARP